MDDNFTGCACESGAFDTLYPLGQQKNKSVWGPANLALGRGKRTVKIPESQPLIRLRRFI